MIKHTTFDCPINVNEFNLFEYNLYIWKYKFQFFKLHQISTSKYKVIGNLLGNLLFFSRCNSLIFRGIKPSKYNPPPAGSRE